MKYLPSISHIKIKLSKIGREISEDHLIVVDRRLVLLLVISLLLCSAAVILKIHGSSIHRWNHLVPQENLQPRGLLAGTPRAVRADEWGTYTPYMLSQVALDYPVVNESIGAGKAPFFSNVPVKHYSAFFRPQFWAFFILDIERAFSAFWAFKTFGLFLSSFALILLLTNNNFWLSLFGAGWIYLSGFIQWWFSIPFLPGMIASANIACISAMYLFLTRNRAFILLSSILFIIFSINLVLFLYPPFLIPLIYLSAFLVGGYLLKNFDKISFDSHRSLRAASIFLAALVPAVILFSIYSETKDTITLITQTAHPGVRAFTSGGLSLTKYFSGFFDVFITESEYPRSWLNVCESSNFILLYPIILLNVTINLFNKQKTGSMELLLLLYILLLSIWLIWGFPPWLAKVTLLDKVHWRGCVGSGVANIILIVIFLNSEVTNRFKRPWGIGLFSGISAPLIAYGMILTRTDEFFEIWKISGVVIFFSVIALLLFYKKQLPFCLGLTISMLPNIFVNPIAAGLDPILDKQLSTTARKIARTDSHSRWIVFGSAQIANFLKASGIKTINGKIFPPDLQTMKILDPTQKNIDIYNRAAFIHVNPVKDANIHEVKFELGTNHFNYQISVDPCSEKLKQIGVRYLVFMRQPVERWMNCLLPLERIRNIWIFEYNLSISGGASAEHYAPLGGDLLPHLSTLPSLPSSTLFSIDYISSKIAYKAEEPIVISADEFLTVRGWAVDKIANDIAGGVYINMNGNLFPARYGLPRPDVAKGYNNNNYELSGFEVAIPGSTLGDHTLSIVILTNDRIAYYAPQKKLIIRVEGVIGESGEN